MVQQLTFGQVVDEHTKAALMHPPARYPRYLPWLVVHLSITFVSYSVTDDADREL